MAHETAESHGLIGAIRAVPGRRADLVGALPPGPAGLPGCLQYVVAEDLDDPDLLWVTEVWESADAHRASLDLPGVQEAIGRGRPLIAGFESRHETRPVAGLDR